MLPCQSSARRPAAPANLIAIRAATTETACQVYTQRVQIRERFGIEGDKTDDLCSACWCPCYALVQQVYEVTARLSSKDKDGGPADGRYQPQAQMQEPPPRYEPGAWWRLLGVPLHGGHLMGRVRVLIQGVQ
ncbi:hypothetical protein DL762_000912 [Monosporascus cannonballus]|uniref:Uncharacterized protein n=1 Tax=Monosporascus cannonballus TaxID=155416 RepID=A0ABY0HKW5_9PEZI|nr:hypothetical protein DL762_000912 [Monosporascus cannonballus]